MNVPFFLFFFKIYDSHVIWQNVVTGAYKALTEWLSYEINLCVLCGSAEFIFSLTPTHMQTQNLIIRAEQTISASVITRQARGREFEYISTEARESSTLCLLIKSLRLSSGPPTSQQRNKSPATHRNHQKTHRN